MMPYLLHHNLITDYERLHCEGESWLLGLSLAGYEMYKARARGVVPLLWFAISVKKL